MKTKKLKFMDVGIEETFNCPNCGRKTAERVSQFIWSCQNPKCKANSLVSKTKLKRYKCEVRKRKIIYAESYTSALSQFMKFMEDYEVEPKVKLVVKK